MPAHKHKLRGFAAPPCAEHHKRGNQPTNAMSRSPEFCQRLADLYPRANAQADCAQPPCAHFLVKAVLNRPTETRHPTRRRTFGWVRSSDSSAEPAGARSLYRPYIGVRRRSAGRRGCWPSTRTHTTDPVKRETMKASEKFERALGHVARAAVAADARRPPSGGSPADWTSGVAACSNTTG